MTTLQLEQKIKEIKARPNPMVYTRITGYYRAVENFNIAKFEEFKQRKMFKL